MAEPIVIMSTGDMSSDLPPELLARERQARADAEAAQQRLQFLYQASSVLFAGSLSGNARLVKLAQLSVPHVADWCLVDLLDQPRSMLRVAATHWDPAKVELGKVFLGRFSYDPAATAGVARVIRTGKAEVIVTEGGAAPGALGSSSESVHVLEELGARSFVVVPLVGVRQTIGAVTFAFAESHRSYGPEEVELLTDLCTRAAWAVENATLYEQAQQAVQAREDLLALVSHDLRNPLGAISMAARMLRTQSHDPAKTLTHSERIERAAGQMERLIRDLLDISAIENGHLAVEKKPWRVATLASEALELMGPLARAKQLQLVAHLGNGGDELIVSCDRDRVLQVFSNLIGNAVKFTPAGGSIVIRAEVEQKWVRFSVEDTGNGISAEELPHIFARYWQARRTDRRGVGLGLSIAEGIVAAHGGRIWVESTVGGGSSFRFTIPLA